MALVYHNGRFIPEDRIQKADAEALVLQQLRSFLDANEPGLVRFLLNTWQNQGKAITYKELREAILAGDIDPQVLEDWMQDYARFVTKYMMPAWEKAIATGAANLPVSSRGFSFNPMADAVRAWTADHAAEFITNVTTTQIDGLRAVVRRAAVLEHTSVDDLARVIRPMVGLSKPQAEANMRYFDNLIESGTSPKRAQDLTTRYAARQHRNRAYSIARTEYATSYNVGAYEGTKQAQAAGLMGETVKVWCTADDERVCPICGKMEKDTVDMDEEFDIPGRAWSTRLTAPAHPGCRCAIIYYEIAPPTPKNARVQLKS